MHGSFSVGAFLFACEYFGQKLVICKDAIKNLTKDELDVRMGGDVIEIRGRNINRCYVTRLFVKFILANLL